MKVTRKLTRDVWFEGAKDISIEGDLLSEIKACLARAQGKAGARRAFSPFVVLEVSKNTHELASLAQNTNKDATAVQVTEAPSEAESDANPEEKAKEKVEYILQNVEIIDADPRVVPVSSPDADGNKTTTATLCLEHIMCTGTNATRQELRLAERPLYSPPGLRFPSIRHLTRAGLQLLPRLGQDPKKKEAIDLGEPILSKLMSTETEAHPEQLAKVKGIRNSAVKTLKKNGTAKTVAKKAKAAEKTPLKKEAAKPASKASSASQQPSQQAAKHVLPKAKSQQAQDAVKKPVTKWAKKVTPAKKSSTEGEASETTGPAVEQDARTPARDSVKGPSDEPVIIAAQVSSRDADAQPVKQVSVPVPAPKLEDSPLRKKPAKSRAWKKKN